MQSLTFCVCASPLWWLTQHDCALSRCVEYGCCFPGLSPLGIHVPSKETAEPTWLWDQPSVIPGKILLLGTL